ncbi:MAG: M48 family metallopeptidase, partial [Azoarcus sp.]|nr:M48 family metallopeptidase [Azoarcus sp.]
VSLNENDEETLAVLAHELGHLAKRHGIRQLIQTSVVAAFSAAWLGDISGAAAAVSASLLSSSYSRDMEREADEYAAYLLKSQGKSPALLADALEKLEAFYREKQNQSKDDKTDKYLDWLSSHPGTSERVQRLRDE